jgi:hypothetical protein
MWRRADKEERAKGERPGERISPYCPNVPGASLKGETRPQANGPAIVNALVCITLYQPPEIWVGIDSGNRQELAANRINIQEERADVSKIERGVRIRGRAQWVVKDIVEISTHLET